MQPTSDTYRSDSDNTWPSISVVITTYDLARYAEFRDCVDSVIEQSYDSYDIVLVTETEGVRDAVARDYGDEGCITIHHLTDGENLATARNAGARASTGDVVAFIDDDAIASSEWITELARGYVESGCDAVGGSADPYWLSQTGWYIPEEFWFLVGATHQGFPEEEGEVRNTFGCNISFRRDVFLNLGCFNTNLGKNHGHNLQSEETEFCARLREETGNGLYYVPDARIKHKVYREQVSLKWLLDRAYWQGYSKVIVDESSEDGLDEEWGFLGYLVMAAVPQYCRAILTNRVAVVHLLLLLVLTAAVGTGFMRGHISKSG